ncbi:hypothetical protein JAAARDRAFT_564962 [Jaapia argillacea MUCL 33604]|uniref:Uncharacterized protein n=1 Tax=Jaapia argillacea MUCL 33604 TaxID=933084 RepID=A0A067Q401_9AGAM|nr:hypothetical protein JAAARDRAFT_564962 [Jaapia argillacea MUCL 33604]
MNPIRSDTLRGLPSTPRSRSVGRYREEPSVEQPRVPLPSHPKSLHLQRSVSPPSSGATPRYPSPPSSSPLQTPRRPSLPSNPRSKSVTRETKRTYPEPLPEPTSNGSHAYSQSIASTISTSSPHSSSGSRFLDRMKSRSGSSSSRTSFETEEEKMPRLPPRGRILNEQRRGDDDLSNPPQFERSSEGVIPSNSFGSSLWDRVALATGSLTVNISKTLAAHVSTDSGEETPPGQESRLIQAMKAYHLGKARGPSGLPEWLFNSYERGYTSRRLFSTTANEESYNRSYTPTLELGSGRVPRQEGFASTNLNLGSTPERRERSQPSVAGDRRDGQNKPSRAVDRLKSLRDAKRSGTRALNSRGINDMVAI